MRRKKYRMKLIFFSKKVRENIILVVLAFLAIFLFRQIYLKIEEKRGMQEDYSLLSSLEGMSDIYQSSIQNMINVKEAETKEKTELQLKIEELQKLNSDVKAWIKIDGTNIDYPILQGKDNEYYLKHDYKKKENKRGSIFFNYKINVEKPSLNFIIYGHHLKSKTMFTDLVNYRKKDFYDKHKIIRLATKKEDLFYEVLAIIETNLPNSENNDVFDYYNYLDLSNEKAYYEYINMVKGLSLYDTGVSATYNEQLITLVTCNYLQKNGRTLVIAKRITTMNNIPNTINE